GRGGRCSGAARARRRRTSWGARRCTTRRRCAAAGGRATRRGASRGPPRQGARAHRALGLRLARQRRQPRRGGGDGLRPECGNARRCTSPPRATSRRWCAASERRARAWTPRTSAGCRRCCWRAQGCPPPTRAGAGPCSGQLQRYERVVAADGAGADARAATRTRARRRCTTPAQLRSTAGGGAAQGRRGGGRRAAGGGGATPLHEAAGAGALAVVRLLIDSAGDAIVNMPDQIYVDLGPLCPHGPLAQMQVTRAFMEAMPPRPLGLLFQHPLLQLFVHLKWRRLLALFLLFTAVHVAFVLSLSYYAYELGPPLKLKCAPAWYPLVGTACMVLLYLAGQIILLPRHYVKEAESWLHLICVLLALSAAVLPLCSWYDDVLNNIYCVDFETKEVMNYSLRGDCCKRSCLSTKNMSVELNSTDTMKEVPLENRPLPLEAELHLLSVAVLLGWAEVMFLLGRFPTIGYYALMFQTVLKNVLKATYDCISDAKTLLTLTDQKLQITYRAYHNNAFSTKLYPLQGNMILRANVNLEIVTLAIIIEYSYSTCKNHLISSFHFCNLSISFDFLAQQLNGNCRLPCKAGFTLYASVILSFSCLVVGYAISYEVQYSRAPEFSSPWKAIVRTAVMMTGEFQYTDLYKNDSHTDTDPKQPTGMRLFVTSRIIFLTFIILAPIALQEEGLVRMTLKQADFVAHLEALTGRLRRARALRGFQRCLLNRAVATCLTLQPLFPSAGAPRIPGALLEALAALALRNRERERRRRRRAQAQAAFNAASPPRTRPPAQHALGAAPARRRRLLPPARRHDRYARVNAVARFLSVILL
ncbi:LOW QUALITY PROTEIN: Uncharacterized protein GBIM_03367, partial [Gryllus bimaculatus]